MECCSMAEPWCAKLWVDQSQRRSPEFCVLDTKGCAPSALIELGAVFREGACNRVTTRLSIPGTFCAPLDGFEAVFVPSPEGAPGCGMNTAPRYRPMAWTQGAPGEPPRPCPRVGPLPAPILDGPRLAMIVSPILLRPSGSKYMMRIEEARRPLIGDSGSNRAERAPRKKCDSISQRKRIISLHPLRNNLQLSPMVASEPRIIRVRINVRLCAES